MKIRLSPPNTLPYSTEVFKILYIQIAEILNNVWRRWFLKTRKIRTWKRLFARDDSERYEIEIHLFASQKEMEQLKKDVFKLGEVT